MNLKGPNGKEGQPEKEWESKGEKQRESKKREREEFEEGLKPDSLACTLASLSGTPLLGLDLIASRYKQGG